MAKLRYANKIQLHRRVITMTAFLTMALIHFLSVVSPGPDFAFVVKNSLQYDRRSAFYTALGIGLGIGVHISYCLLGLAIIIVKSIFVFNIIKFLGAAYLIYIGIKALFAKSNSSAKKTSPHVKAVTSISTWQAIKQGFLCNVLNPKASLFILGLFTLVIKPTTPLVIQIFYGIWMMVVTFLWFAFLAGVITHPYIRSKIFRIQPIVSRCMGAFLVLFGLKLVFTTR
jgi:RhtB (resistance to homoserine/threonine) family protein